MSSLTVWKFQTPFGAEAALQKLEGLQTQGLIQVQDAAVVSWEAGRKKPKTEQMHDTKKGGALGGGFWGLLFGLIFFIPILGPGHRRRHRRAAGLAGRRRDQRLVHQDGQGQGHPGHLGAVPAQLRTP